MWLPLLFLTLGFDTPSSRVDTALAQLQCFQADFQQETHSDFFDATISSGELTICRPGRMRMEYREGERRLMIWDGETCFEYDHLADTTSTQPQAELRDDPLVRLLLYEGSVATHFEVAQKEQIAEPTYVLTPKQDDSYQIILTFNQANLPHRLEVQNNDGESVYLTFSNYSLKVSPAPSTFKIPASK